MGWGWAQDVFVLPVLVLLVQVGDNTLGVKR